MTLFSVKLRDFFTKVPSCQSAFQFSSCCFSGIHISNKERKIKNHFILPLEEGMIQPSFTKKNMKNYSFFEERIKREVDKLHIPDRKIAFILPESSQKSFIFSFDSLSYSNEEREKVILFRVKKLMPFLPEDTRVSYDSWPSDGNIKIIATIARASVIKEYEDFFSRLHLKVRAVGVPSLSLSNLLRMGKKEAMMLVNIEKDSLSFVVFIHSEIILYRQRPFLIESKIDKPSELEMKDIIQEIFNTSNFVEDKEKKKIVSIWVRSGLMNENEEMILNLKDKLSISVNGVESSLPFDMSLNEKHILSPLLGQIL